MKTKLFYFFTLLFLSLNYLNATTYYVRSSTGSDGNDGSQSNPFETLNIFFDGTVILQDGDIIDIEGTFNLSNKVIGRSITITGNNKSNSIIQGTVAGQNCFTIGGAGVWPTVVLENITFKDFDYFDEGASRSGGAIQLSRGNVTIKKSNFISNRSYTGGAIAILPSATGDESTVLIEDCYFFDNKTKKRSAAANADGGAINVDTSIPILSLTIDRCLFENNITERVGSALRIAAKGNNSTVLVQNSTFIGNEVSLLSNQLLGNTIWIESTTSNTNCDFKLINNTIAYNSNKKTEASAGSGIIVSSTAPGMVSLINNILFSNVNVSDVSISVTSSVNLKEARNNITDTSFDFAAKTPEGMSSGNQINITSVSLSLSETLEDKGGETKVLTIGSTSVAINTGYTIGVPAIDQTGYTRTITDVGAFEWRDITSLYTNKNISQKISYTQIAGKLIFKEIADYNAVRVYAPTGQLITKQFISGNSYEFSGNTGLYIFVFENGTENIAKKVLLK